MKHLREITYHNDLKEINRTVQFLEAEYSGMMETEVMVNEHDENVLNSMFTDIERRIEAARRGLKLANRIRDPEERRVHKSKMMAHLNRTRAVMDKIVKTYYPERVASGDEGSRTNRDEFISPQQAAETLGIPTSKLQNYVVSNRLKMHNHNGRWALKGSEVQALADQLRKGRDPREVERMNQLRSRYTNRASFDVQ